jgi:hypothetical protein
MNAKAATQDLQTIQEGAPLAPASEAMSLLAVIERAARDPMVDVNKMRELMAMRKEIVAEQAAQAFDEAMTHVQEEMRPIAADASNPQTRSKYASYLALDRAMRPIYTRHGFNLTGNTAEGAPEGYVRVVCDVSRSGHTRRYQVDMPADGKGAKGGDVMTKTHAVGSAMTYGQRYLLKLIFNIAVGEDDDGNRASGDPTISADQIGELQAMIESVGANKELFLKYFKVETLADIPTKKFQAAVDALNAKAKRS